MKKNTQKKSGFTLFIAVVVSGLMLIVVLSISNIALKETILSGAGRDSELAFYAADSGIECALFWDYRNPGHDHTAFLSSEQEIVCGSEDVEYTPASRSGVGIPAGSFAGFNPGDPDSPNKPSSGNPAVSNFIVSFNNRTCAKVEVVKYYVGSVIKTTIESRGQSDCGNLSNPRRFERAIRVIDSQ